MFKDITEREIVLFLGAGFSASAGLPTMSEFGNHARIENFNLKNHARAGIETPNYRFAAPMLVDSAFIYDNFKKICSRSQTLTDEDINNLETIFCIAEILREAGQEIINIDGQPYSIEVVFKYIQLWLWKIYQQYPFINDKKIKEKENEPSYDKFFHLIRESIEPDNITVITTNYDLIFEFKSFVCGMNCSYFIKDVKVIQAGHGFKEYVFVNHDDNIKGPIICKLHGSVNFFQNHSNHGENCLYISNDLGNSEPIGKSYRFDKIPAMFAVDAIWNIQKKYGETFFPAIIPPTYSKLYHRDWLIDIWNNAFIALRQARKIVFIGYSIPASDGFMRALIHAAMAFRSNKHEFPEIYVIDNNLETHKRYKEIFKTMYREIHPQTFLDAINNGTFELIFN